MGPKLTTLFAIVFVAAPLARAQNDNYEKRALAYGKRVPVSRLDASLPKQPFAEWFKKIVGPKAKIKWEVNDCGEQTGTAADIGRDFPSCVQVEAELFDNRKVVVLIAVGTFRKGIWGRPTVFSAFIQHETTTRDAKKLGELSKMLSQYDVTQ